MLKTIRIILAALFFLGVTALFLDVSGALRPWLGWTAKMQLLPAAFALNAAALTGIALLTLLFGRVYCSVVCPLGVFQDIISGAGAGNKKRRRRPGYVPERRWLRYGVLALFLAAAALGAGSIAALLEPYSAFGRMVSNLFAPFCGWGNNLLAAGAEKAGSCAFSETSVWMRGWPTFAVSALTFAALAVLARRHGRAYCGNICPVGTLLGLLSRFSLSSARLWILRCAAHAGSAPGNARPRASISEITAWMRAAAWPVWTASARAGSMPSACGPSGKKLRRTRPRRKGTGTCAPRGRRRGAAPDVPPAPDGAIFSIPSLSCWARPPPARRRRKWTAA